MKVLILITKSNWGGAQRYVYDLATNLPKDSFEVEVMAGGNGTLIEKLIQAGIPANGDLPVGRNISVIDDIKAFFKLIQILRQKRPDVLHVNSSKIGGIGALAGRLTRVPKIIFTGHGWAFNEDRTFASKLIIKFLHWLTIFLSHQTIAVSYALQEQVAGWPYISDKIKVVHNGIKTEPSFSKANARLELGRMNPQLMEIIKSTKSLTMVGSVGELHPIKGYEHALQALKKINKKVLYLIIGDGENKEKIEQQIIDHGLEKSVILMGRVPSASQYIKAFDVFLMPSLSEGLPYVLLEAGLASLPVVATAVGGIPEVIDDMKSGILIQSRKPTEIKNALEFYLTHKKTMTGHGKILHEKVIAEFSTEKMISQTIEVYNS